ncbi:MAG: transcriptional regulator [Brevundimonas sp.]|nr:MAG: transcriptional regulator [Brevundimonas sp.]
MLKTLVQHGVLEARLYSERPPRNEYVLTAKGKDLYGVLVTLHAWGAKHVYGEENAGLTMVHKACGHDLSPRIACGHCNEIVRPRDIQVIHDRSRMTVGEVMPREDAA